MIVKKKEKKAGFLGVSLNVCAVVSYSNLINIYSALCYLYFLDIKHFWSLIYTHSHHIGLLIVDY